MPNFSSVFKLFSHAHSSDTSKADSLTDLIIVTDSSLRKVLSANDAAEQTFQLPRSAIINHDLFDILYIKNQSGQLIDESYFLSDRLRAENSTQTFTDLILYTKNSVDHRPVTIRISPMSTVKGQVSQFTVVVSPSSENFTPKGQGFEQVKIKHQAMIEDLKRQLLTVGLPDLLSKIFLIEKVEQDLFFIFDNSNQTIKPKKTLTDIAKLCNNLVEQQQQFSRLLNVPLEFALDTQSLLKHVPPQFNVSPLQLTSISFLGSVDTWWLNFLLTKILDLSIFLTSDTPTPHVQLSINQNDKNQIIIRITANHATLTDVEQKQLFLQGYGDLSQNTNLSIGSGLEGVIIKRLSDELNYPLTIGFEYNPTSMIVFQIQIPKHSVPLNRES